MSHEDLLALIVSGYAQVLVCLSKALWLYCFLLNSKAEKKEKWKKLNDKSQAFKLDEDYMAQQCKCVYRGLK